jgi:septum formation protein
MRLVLASASPARLSTLRAAGIDPEVVVSGFDESQIVETDPRALTLRLAEAKAAAVARLESIGDADLVLGCDSVLQLDGETLGKPPGPAAAAARWRRMRGRTGVLVTGHHLIAVQKHAARAATAETRVEFADVSDAEIDAYVATGEPLGVAGAFTIDGLGGPFVRGVDGDPHNVVGISLPLLRELVRELGWSWPELWAKAT